MSENNNNQNTGSSASPFLVFLAGTAGRIVITIVSAVLIWGLLGILLKTDNTVILGITLVACGYFGWRALNRITPEVFLWMPLASWLVYFVVKGVLSVIIGAIVGPFWIGKTISSTIMGKIS